MPAMIRHFDHWATAAHFALSNKNVNVKKDLTFRKIGVSPHQIRFNSEWWHGPNILYEENVESSSEPVPPPDEVYLQGFKHTLPMKQH
ncbi:hypothetical protein TNCV_1965841 [Trichonephila clavipes]|nr:hypothetical protein TNCV_1965841 [Trichonephila clavipes]